MHSQLSKSDKKIARACIDKGIDAEFHEGLSKCEKILRNWSEGKFVNNKEAYHQLYDTLHTKDEAIAKRYDGLTGSRWLLTVAAILNDGFITEEDIKDFSAESKNEIETWLRFWNAKDK
jgi:hypothetical protein